jgi:hypothetical protein
LTTGCSGTTHAGEELGGGAMSGFAATGFNSKATWFRI